MLFVISGIFGLEGILYGILAFVLRKKRTSFPDFRVGYHVKSAMRSREEWEFVNDRAGAVCGIFSALFFLSAGAVYGLEVSKNIGVILLLALSVLGVGSTLWFPCYLRKKRFG